MLSAGSFILVATKIAWTTGNIEPLKWAAEVFGVSYLTARQKNGVSKPANEEKNGGTG
jgi:hypothetical protein